MAIWSILTSKRPLAQFDDVHYSGCILRMITQQLTGIEKVRDAITMATGALI